MIIFLVFLNDFHNLQNQVAASQSKALLENLSKLQCISVQGNLWLFLGQNEKLFERERALGYVSVNHI